MTELTEKQKLCLVCMECCRTLAFSLPKKSLDKQTRDFYEARGSKFKKQGPFVWVIVPSVCPNLTTLGCKIYPQRPVVCRVFDGRNYPFMAGICKWSNLGG